MIPFFLVVGLPSTNACTFANSGMPIPNDATHRRLVKGIPGIPGVLPHPLDASKNAFVSRSLLAPPFSGGSKTLLQTLSAFAATQKEELCYWSWQPLPPPLGGPSLFHPFRKYWDLQDGSLDEDLEWVKALGEVAVARLHSLVTPKGPVVAAMCAGGHESAKRRCTNGKGDASFCVNSIVNQSLAWPMAVAIFNISHPDLEATIGGWRKNASMHSPNIHWAMGAGSKPTSPWNGGGADPSPGDLNPPGMPQGPDFPVSKAVGWGVGPGAGMLAKLVPCSQIPDKYVYSTDNFYCDQIAADGKHTTVDEAYEKWTSLVSVWPPTKPCVDDIPGLNKAMAALHLPAVKDCATAKKHLQWLLPNWDCNALNAEPPLFRDVCCSECGGEPIPDLSPPTPAPVSPGAMRCTICQHVYDPRKDGGGKAFEDLPDTWSCPICGAPKSVYVKSSGGEWVHVENEPIV